MTKYFKNKKTYFLHDLIKFMIIIITIYYSIKICIVFLLKTHFLNHIYSQNKVSSYYNVLKDATINNPTSFLPFKTDNTKTLLVINTKENINDNNKPKIYIYNSHPKEKYSDNYTTVFDMDYKIKETFLKNNIDVEINEADIEDFLITNNLDYAYSYYASRFFIKDSILSGNYNLIIDLHRDAALHDFSYININGINYAKILFVVGKEHNNYEANLALANKLNSLFDSRYPGLSRGVMLKSGPDVNGLYNQDLDPNMILLELGSDSNSVDEVNNTIEIVCDVIGEYLYGTESI